MIHVYYLSVMDMEMKQAEPLAILHLTIVIIFPLNGHSLGGFFLSVKNNLNIALRATTEAYIRASALFWGHRVIIVLLDLEYVVLEFVTHEGVAADDVR